MSWRVSIAALAVLAVVGLLTYGLLLKGSVGLKPGDVAPAPAMPRLQGAGESSLRQYRGRWVLVNFWASWCPPCHEEAPALERFQRSHAGRDFTILGIDTRDISGDGRAFVRRYGLTYPQLRDGNGETAHDYGTSGVPENFLVNPRGKLKLVVNGPVTETYLNHYVAPLLLRRSETS